MKYSNQNAELENSYQKRISKIHDEIQELKEDVAEDGHDSLHDQLTNANTRLANAWKIAVSHLYAFE